MTPQCSWQDSCLNEATWVVADQDAVMTAARYKNSCDEHFAETVREAAVDWLGCWVEKI